MQLSIVLLISCFFPISIRCQCENDWFGSNCTQINRCQTNTCPDGFICQTIDENYQECLAIGTFEGNSSFIHTQINRNQMQTDEITFRLRANQQTEHLFTIQNRNTSTNLSVYLAQDQFRIRLKNDEFFIELDNQTYDQWTTYNFQWLNQSIFIFNNQTMNSTIENIFLPNTQIEIRLGNGFRGCLEYFLLGSNVYIPFYNQTNVEIENIQINNCTFDDLCRNVGCKHGQCIEAFDRGICQCQRGWEGDLCEKNIDECQRENNCSKEHSQCIDHLDGYYTCQCQQGFTGQFCETNFDECASNPCANGGLCIDLVNGYMCNCTNNYISSHCSISLDETCFGRRNTCQHNGTCLLTSPNLYVDQPKTECQCRDGYSGEQCQFDACSNYTCQNNGTCQRLPNGKAKCLCTNEWQGNQCEDDIDECLIRKKICLNNGKCVNQRGGYECHCQEYYLGARCEREHVCLKTKPCLNQGHCRTDGETYYCECSTNYTGLHCEYSTCESIPCENNGTCQPNSSKGFTCNCTNTGYDGERCEMELNECLSNPCQNNATCIDQINGYICTCPRSFMGYNCDEKKFLAVLGFSYHYVIWPGVAVILLLIIILLSILISRIRESRRSRGTYRPALNENGQSSRVEFSMILKPPPEERLI